MYILHVADQHGQRDYLTIVDPERFGERKVPSVALVGMLKVSAANGGRVTPDNLMVNPEMVRFLHRFVAATAPAAADARAAARAAFARGEAWLQLVDRRGAGRWKGEPEDLIGSFELVDGELLERNYRPNGGHRLLTDAGIFSLPESMQSLYVEALVAQTEQPQG